MTWCSTQGSIISAINDTSVSLETFEVTLKQLMGWSPPFKITFRKAPEKKGTLPFA